MYCNLFILGTSLFERKADSCYTVQAVCAERLLQTGRWIAFLAYWWSMLHWFARHWAVVLLPSGTTVRQVCLFVSLGSMTAWSGATQSLVS